MFKGVGIGWYGFSEEGYILQPAGCVLFCNLKFIDLWYKQGLRPLFGKRYTLIYL